MAGQLLESKHSLLQARVEHLELDLGFKARGERRDKQRFVDVVRRKALKETGLWWAGFSV